MLLCGGHIHVFGLSENTLNIEIIHVENYSVILSKKHTQTIKIAFQ